MHEYCMGLQKYSPTLGFTRRQETFKKVYANSFEEALVKWSKLTGEKILGWDLHLLYTTDFNAYFQIIQERIRIDLLTALNLLIDENENGKQFDNEV